jgi:glycosyltransferase involved in cell wall biosynthesis
MITSSTRHENVVIPIDMPDWSEVHGITLCCITLNEEKEIKEFLEYHKPYVDHIVMIDGGSRDRTVEIATPIVDNLIMRRFDGHYSNQANRAVENSKTDWILLMDCDERIEKKTLESLRSLINQEEFDCYSFPRKNFINGERDLRDEPDYQERLYRSYCRRIRPVHGEVVGFKKRKFMPKEDGNYIIHSKSSDRHALRNHNYQIFELKFLREMGEPGTQNKEAFYNKYNALRTENFIVR